mgnify:CR=1 FL=1
MGGASKRQPRRQRLVGQRVAPRALPGGRLVLLRKPPSSPPSPTSLLISLLLSSVAPAQVWPREFRRATDEASKLKTAQAAETELLKEVGG